jgi:hypothetical protein
MMVTCGSKNLTLFYSMQFREVRADDRVRFRDDAAMGLHGLRRSRITLDRSRPLEFADFARSVSIFE